MDFDDLYNNKLKIGFAKHDPSDRDKDFKRIFRRFKNDLNDTYEFTFGIKVWNPSYARQMGDSNINSIPRSQIWFSVKVVFEDHPIAQV